MALLAAGNDVPDVKPGGKIPEILSGKKFGGKCVFLEFPEMQHGWVTRGDTGVEEVKRDVERALEVAILFFERNLKEDKARL